MRRWQTSPTTSVVVTPARSSFRHRSMKRADCCDSPSKPYTKMLAVHENDGPARQCGQRVSHLRVFEIRILGDPLQGFGIDFLESRRDLHRFVPRFAGAGDALSAPLRRPVLPHKRGKLWTDPGNGGSLFLTAPALARRRNGTFYRRSAHDQNSTTGAEPSPHVGSADQPTLSRDGRGIRALRIRT